MAARQVVLDTCISGLTANEFDERLYGKVNGGKIRLGGELRDWSIMACNASAGNYTVIVRNELFDYVREPAKPFLKEFNIEVEQAADDLHIEATFGYTKLRAMFLFIICTLELVFTLIMFCFMYSEIARDAPLLSILISLAAPIVIVGATVRWWVQIRSLDKKRVSIFKFFMKKWF